MSEKKGERASDQDGHPGEVAESCLRQQVDGSGAQVGRDKERADQIPEAVQRFAPPEGAADELSAGADAVPQKSDGPDELKAVPALQPLIEDHRRENDAEQR